MDETSILNLRGYRPSICLKNPGDKDSSSCKNLFNATCIIIWPDELQQHHSQDYKIYIP